MRLLLRIAAATSADSTTGASKSTSTPYALHTLPYAIPALQLTVQIPGHNRGAGDGSSSRGGDGNGGGDTEPGRGALAASGSGSNGSPAAIELPEPFAAIQELRGVVESTSE
ncbi:hypothetical protein Vretifemale_14699, partial [Volvox reticuliferus]